MSPFSEYEKRYCEECDDYNGCIGLILKASIGSGEFSEEFLKRCNEADKAWLDMMKNIGASMFVQKYSTIINCIRAREFMK